MMTFSEHSSTSFSVMMAAHLSVGLLALTSTIINVCEAAAAASSSASSSCLPSTLHISDKVHHRPRFLTIAHRGASFHLPEHTLPAYRLALELGADFIEPDLIVTADGRLIAHHSLDLNATTNIASFYPNRQPWFSPFVNRSGYWSFNYTYDEIAQLTVRQRLPDARTTFYDGQWKIPSLEEILATVNTWNRDVVPKLFPPDADAADSPLNVTSSSTTPMPPRKPTLAELSHSGIYVELKDPAWIKQEAGFDIVELLFEHLEQHQEAWSQLLPCLQEMRYDEYKVPGLVIQSFDAKALQNFHETWSTRQPLAISQEATGGDDSQAQEQQQQGAGAPEPPYVLLVGEEECKTQEFWLKVGDEYRNFISGIGPSKACLLAPLDKLEGGAKEEEEELAKESFSAIKAREFNLVLHPWTERPEYSFLTEGYDSIWDETLELFCRVGVQGIFTEAVATAIAVAKFGCDNDYIGNSDRNHHSHHKGGKRGSSSSDLCYDSEESSSSWNTVTTGFVLGLGFSALCVVAYIRLYTNNGRGAFRRWQFSQIGPQNGVADENNHEMNNRPRGTRNGTASSTMSMEEEAELELT